MALLESVANKLSQNWLISGVLEEFVTQDELFSIVPFKQINGKMFTYNRESTLSTTAFIGVNETLTDSEADTTEVTGVLKILGGIFSVDDFLEDTQSDIQDQYRNQQSAKVKAASQEFRDKFINGDTGVSTKQFDGVKVLCTAAQTINHNQPLTFASLDQLISKVKAGRIHALCGNDRTIRDYYELVRATPGMSPEWLKYQAFNEVFNVAQYRRLPILLNDYINDDESVASCTDGTSMYAFHLNEVHGVAGMTSKKNGGLRIRGPVDMLSAGKFAIRGGVSWYGGVYLGSTLALARLAGICHTVP